MKMFVEPADVYLYMDIVDFRKSINGLIVVVEQNMELNAFRDALFVFCNKIFNNIHKRKTKTYLHFSSAPPTTLLCA